MQNIDFTIYLVQGAFWITFGIGRYMQRHLYREDSVPLPRVTQKSQREFIAPFSRTLVLFHALAFVVMYVGLGIAVIPNRVPVWFQGQRIAGAIVIEGGGILAAWAVLHFHSWRFRAKLDPNHELVTTGPFRILRHPIYAGLNLFALGTALWVPVPLVWFGFVLMTVGSDLRARSEEEILKEAFGNTYREYCAHTRRFVPGLY